MVLVAVLALYYLKLIKLQLEDKVFSTFFLLLLSTFLVIFSLNLNNLLLFLAKEKSHIVLAAITDGSFLSTATNCQIFPNNYSYVLMNYTLTLLDQCL